MEETGTARIFDGGQTTAGDVAPLEAQHLEPRPAGVGLEDQTVVAGTKNNAVIGCHARPPRVSRRIFLVLSVINQTVEFYERPDRCQAGTVSP